MSTKLSERDIATFKAFRQNHHSRLDMLDDRYEQSVKILGSVDKYNCYKTWWADGIFADLQHAQNNFQRPNHVYGNFVQLVTTHASNANLQHFRDTFRYLNMPVIPMGVVRSKGQKTPYHFRLVLSLSNLVPMTMWQDDDYPTNVDWIPDPRDRVATGMMSLFKHMDDRTGNTSGSTVSTGDSGYKSGPSRKSRRPLVGPLEPRIFHQLGGVQSTMDPHPNSATARWTDTGFTLIVNMYDHHPWILLNPVTITDAGPSMIPDGQRQSRFPGLHQPFSLARLDFDSSDHNEPHLHRLFDRYDVNFAFSLTQIERCPNFWIDHACRNPKTGTVTRVGEPGEPTENQVEVYRGRSRYTEQ